MMEDITLIKMGLGAILGALVHIGYNLRTIHAELQLANDLRHQ